MIIDWDWEVWVGRGGVCFWLDWLKDSGYKVFCEFEYIYIIVFSS